jgi:hypothetical protein
MGFGLGETQYPNGQGGPERSGKGRSMNRLGTVSVPSSVGQRSPPLDGLGSFVLRENDPVRTKELAQGRVGSLQKACVVEFPLWAGGLVLKVGAETTEQDRF